MSAVGYSAQSDAVAARAEGRIAELMGVINSATASLVSVISEVIESGAWGGGGVRSPEHWVAWRCGVSAERARGLVTMARRLPDLPVVAADFANGRLAEDSVRLIAARTPPERDAEVAEMARLMTVPQLARVLRSVPKVDPEPQPQPRPDDRGNGEVSFGHDDGDRWSMRATDLPAERGAVVAEALQAARDAEFRRRNPEAAEGAPAKGVTWADALERMALAALEALDPTTAADPGRSPSDRYQVIVHVRAGDGPSAHFHLGPALSASARRRLTCDARLRWVLEDGGRPLAWGRRRRTVDPVLRRLIEDRDRGCRIPGCTQRQGLEVHHIVHVEDGGETVDSNLVLTCSRHHADHHRGLFGIFGDPTTPGGLVITDRWGRRIDPPPPRPPDRLPSPPSRWEGPSGEPLQARWFAWAGAG